MHFSTISIIGLGYIGLPTAAMFASHKKQVIGVDINQQVVHTINRGDIHIVEPQLETLVRACVTEGYLKASMTPVTADAFLIAVPTPFKQNHEPDLSYIEAAVCSIANVLKQGNLVILESTSPIGTTEKISQWLADARPDLTFPHTAGENSDIRICYCPERVLPGHSIRELVENDRVIGGLSARCAQVATDLYKIFVEGKCLITTARTAEMTKLVENSFRDVNIAFANELSIICEKLNINIWELIKLANHHPRVNILQPGSGVGGHCIAVDPWFIVSSAPEEAKLIRMAREINDAKPEMIINLIEKHATQHQTKKIICLGAAFKANIDDLRESPALKIILALLHKGYEIELVEPNIAQLPEILLHTNCTLISLDTALTHHHNKITAALVAHKEFQASDMLKKTISLDFCGIMDS